ncbi:MAG: (2Fe-2S)-binding protein [Alphaproteobacteria bacterium]|nr:(2Fe-2S)-binding protein [Alphaproteobacteria bacterium]
MFRRLPDAAAGPLVPVTIDGQGVMVPEGESAAAAALAAGMVPTRTTPVSGAPRAPWCMMGVCFECLMEIDGEPNMQGCMVPVRAGMVIRRQEGARRLPAMPGTSHEAAGASLGAASGAPAAAPANPQG